MLSQPVPLSRDRSRSAEEQERVHVLAGQQRQGQWRLSAVGRRLRACQHVAGQHRKRLQRHRRLLLQFHPGGLPAVSERVGASARCRACHPGSPRRRLEAAELWAHSLPAQAAHARMRPAAAPVVPALHLPPSGPCATPPVPPQANTGDSCTDTYTVTLSCDANTVWTPQVGMLQCADRAAVHWCPRPSLPQGPPALLHLPKLPGPTAHAPACTNRGVLSAGVRRLHRTAVGRATPTLPAPPLPTHRSPARQRPWP